MTQTHTRDNLGREIQLLEKGSSGLLRETTTSYEDGNRRVGRMLTVVTTSDNVTPGDQQLVSVTDYDQLGRVRLARQLESAGGRRGDGGLDGDEFGLEPSGFGFDVLCGRGFPDSGGDYGVYGDWQPSFLLFGEYDGFGG